MRIATKICGLSTAATMAVAIEAGADYVGLVLFSKSPRNVAVDRAVALANQARGRSRIVALAVDPGPELLSVIGETIKPDVLQLHGYETPADVASVRAELERWGLSTCRIWKAIPVAAASDLDQVNDYLSITDLILFDAKAPKDAVLPGGNGRSFDWSLLKAVGGRYPFMLSGGLTPDNVAEAIVVTGAQAVDVSSGVETAPGIKDPELIRRFLRAANGSK